VLEPAEFGVAGPTMVWDRAATNMPSMRPMKTSFPSRSRPVNSPSAGRAVADVRALDDVLVKESPEERVGGRYLVEQSPARRGGADGALLRASTRIL
jgi:hypothetical protein